MVEILPPALFRVPSGDDDAWVMFSISDCCDVVIDGGLIEGKTLGDLGISSGSTEPVSGTRRAYGSSASNGLARLNGLEGSLRYRSAY